MERHPPSEHSEPDLRTQIAAAIAHRPRVHEAHRGHAGSCRG